MAHVGLREGGQQSARSTRAARSKRGWIIEVQRPERARANTTGWVTEAEVR